MSLSTKLNIESIIDGSIEKVKLAESVQESLNKLESKTDIVASQIFLELHTAYDDFQVFSHKRGYEEHNRKVCQRLIENCFSDKAPNNEMFFVTINGMRDGVPYMETAILESHTEEIVRASFVKGNFGRESSIAASIGVLAIDLEILRYYAESGEVEFYWKYISTLVPSIDAIGSESDVYVTEFTFEEITTNGRAVKVSPKLVSAIYNNRIIVIPGKNGNFIATNTFSLPSEAPVGIQMKIQAGVVIYDVVLRAVGPAPQTVQTVVRAMNLLSGTLNTINGASIASGVDMPLVSSISLNSKTYTPTKGAVDLGEINVEEVKFANDLTGVVEATPEMFTYRPSAGDKSVRDESAVIRRIKGNTSVWGQYVTTFEEIAQQRVSQFNYLGNGVFEVLDDRRGDNLTLSVGKASDRAIPGHKYLFYVDAEGTYKSVFYAGFSSYSRVEGNWKIDTCVSSSPFYFYPFEASSTIVPKGTRCTIREMLLFDLTAIFGAGNEPTTYEEFREYYPDAYYPYCEPEVRSMRATGIETVGFNQWDEEWELGGINVETGELTNSSTNIRSKNFIPVIGGKTYNFYCKRTDITLYFRVATYDVNKKHIGYIKSGVYPSTSITSANFNNPWTFDKDVAYIKFDVANTYGTVYKNDICINLSHSGVRNGEYESYEKNTLLLPEISKYFPNGMHGIGDMCDEIIDGLAIQRFGVVDLGSLTWQQSTSSVLNYEYFFATLENLKESDGYGKYANAICSEFIQSPSYSINDRELLDESFMIYYIKGNNTLYMRSSETTLEIFKNKVNGILLYYELAEPIYTPIDEPLQLAYKVDDFGTERMVSDLPSSPFKADIVYQFNAEGRIRDNSRNIERLENKLINKQDKLTSGTNIKFINGESVLGDGNLVIDGNTIFVANDLDKQSQLLNTTIKQYGELIESKYVKSETGIPATDLSEEVQTSLGKADNSVRLTTGGGDINPGYNGDKQFYIQKVNGVQTLKIEMLTKSDVLSGKYTGNNGNSPFVGADIVYDLYNNAYDLADSKYTKPEDGISYEDLHEDVQTLLDKADSAVQTISYKKTPTTTILTQLSKNEDKNITIPVATTSNCGLTMLSDSISSTSTATAATSSAVKQAYDLANSKYTKPEEGILINDLEVYAQEAVSKAHASVSVSDLEYEVVAFTIDDIDNCAMSGDVRDAEFTVDNEINSNNFRLGRKPLMIKKSADSNALYPLTYTKPGNAIVMNYTGTVSCVVEGVTYEFNISYSNTTATIFNIKRYYNQYVADFRIYDLEKIINEGISKSINTEKLYLAIQNNKNIVVYTNEFDPDYSKGVMNILTGGITSDNNELKIFDCVINTHDGSWKLTNLVYDTSDPEGGHIYSLNNSNVKFYYTQPYVLEFTVDDIVTMFEDGEGTIEYNSFALCTAFKNGRSVVIKHDDSTNSKVHTVIGSNDVVSSSSTKFAWYFINDNSIFRVLTFLSQQPDQDIYEITYRDITEYSLPNLNGYASLIAKSELINYINGKSIYRSSNNNSTSIYTYYPVKPVASGSRALITPNAFWKLGSPSTPLSVDSEGYITITLGREISGVVNEYIFEIYTGADTDETPLPSLKFKLSDGSDCDIKWVSGDAPVLEENKTYQISIINKLGTVLSWDNA